MSKLKIFHTADIQVNCAGKHYGRHNEYEYMLQQMSETVINGGFQIVVLAGDLFERWNANDTEKSLLIDNFLRPILNTGRIKILWTDGNHDIKQSNFTFDPGDGTVNEEVNALKALTKYINDDNLIYAEETNFYSLGEVDGKEVISAVWAHKSKYSAEVKTLNPWAILANKPLEVQESFKEKLDNAVVFDVFHDPVKNAKNFDGKVVRGNNDGRVDVKEFHGQFSLMGDIHQPDILLDPERPNFFATYPSSPIICYFGEGDYYDNFKLTQESNNSHGYNEITFVDGIAKCTWKKLNQYTTRHTIILDENAKVEDVEDFDLVNPSEIHNMVKVVLQSFENVEVLDAIIKKLTSKYVCSFATETKYQSTSGMVAGLDENFDISKLSDRDYIIKLARKCIEDKVNATKDTDDYKQKLIEDTLRFFEKALDAIEYTIPISKYKFGGLWLKNFMPIDDIKIDFDVFRNTSSIVKINGNNGTGKTTIFKGLSWVTGGKIDKRQADNKVKQNNLDYFNDKAWNIDITEGGISVTRGEDLIEVSRLIKRIWNAKTTDEDKKSVGWKQFVTKVEEEVLVKLNGTVLPAVDANLLIEDVFGGFDKFQSLHIINQSSLDNMLLNMPLNDLINHILKSIGFTISEQLDKGKETVKEDIFKGTVKHAKDIAGINIDINIKSQEIENAENEIKEVESNIETAINSLSVSTQEKSKLSLKLHNVSDEDVLQIPKKENIIQSINTTQLEINNTEKLIENPNWNDAKQAELDEKNKEVKELSATLLSKTQEVGKFQNEINFINLDKGAKESEIQTITNNFNKSIQDEVLSIKNNQVKALGRISELKNEIIKNENKSIEEKNKSVVDEVDALTKTNEEITAKINKVEIGIASLSSKNEEKELEINNLLSGNCSVCDKSYAELPKVKSEVETIRSVIRTNEENLKKLDAGLESFKIQKSENVTKINSLNETKIALKTSFEEIATFVTENQPLNEELIKLNSENNHEAVNKSIELIESKKIEGEKKERIDLLQSEISILSENTKEIQNKIDLLNIEISGIPQKVQDINVTIGTMELEKTNNSKESLYKNLLTLKDNLNSYNQKLSKINETVGKVSENKLVKVSIEEIDAKIKKYEESQSIFNDQVSRIKIKLNTLQVQKNQLESNIDEIKAYEHANNVWKTFTHVVSPKGLNKYVFDTVAMQINTELNLLLDGLNYRIFFDLSDGYVLKMVDLLGQKSIRNLYTIGGMESTLGALSLVTIIKAKTIKNNGDFIFIDEITGKLNNSEDTLGTHSTNKDYQMEFFQILNKMSVNTNICIIDHVLPIEWFKGVINIVKYDNGRSELVKE